MDLFSPALIYAFLLVPMLFALTVTGQGIYKITKDEDDGTIVLGLGIFLLVLIVVVYFWFIR